MIISIIILILDFVILNLNNQNILKIQVLYIAILVIRLWAHKQPYNYEVNRQNVKEKGQQLNKDKLKDCSICNKLKPSRYYHCRRCIKCIYRMDHHCQWVNNCIGQYNFKIYLHLLINVFIHAAIVLIITIINISHLFDTSRYQVYYLTLLIPVIYALYQSYRLIHDFYLCVLRNQTLIQSFKKVAGKKISFMKSFESYMGKNILSWLLPTFQTNINCNLLQQTYSLTKDEEIKQYTFADEYIYGQDDQEFDYLDKQQ